LACPDLGDAGFVAYERSLSFLALALLAHEERCDKLLNVVDGRIIRLCKQHACALELQASGQQVFAPPVLLSLGLGLQNRHAGTQLFPDGVDPSTETRHRLGGNLVNVNSGAGFLQAIGGRPMLEPPLRMKALRRTLSFILNS
jgi:hypothetical protein